MGNAQPGVEEWLVSAVMSLGLVWGLAATRRSVCIHQMNWVNSHSDHGHDDSTINISVCIVIFIIINVYVRG